MKNASKPMQLAMDLAPASMAEKPVQLDALAPKAKTARKKPIGVRERRRLLDEHVAAAGAEGTTRESIIALGLGSDMAITDRVACRVWAEVDGRLYLAALAPKPRPIAPVLRLPTVMTTLFRAVADLDAIVNDARRAEPSEAFSIDWPRFKEVEQAIRAIWEGPVKFHVRSTGRLYGEEELDAARAALLQLEPVGGPIRGNNVVDFRAARARRASCAGGAR